MKLNLRDLFWFIFIVAVALAWWVDRSQLTRDHATWQQIIPPATREPILHAWKMSTSKHPLRSFRQDEDDEVTINFGWGTTSVGAGEKIRLKKTGDTWKVVEQYEYDV